MVAAPLNFDWTRFWVSREGHLALDDDGFLADPTGAGGTLLNPDARPFEDVARHRCVVLLGEPGIGKSTELERVNRQGASAPVAVKVLKLNLRDYSSDALLVQELFHSSAFLEWTRGSHELLLSLDSLDECMLRVETVANLLASHLDRYPFDRLWLRIACRTAIWAQLQQLLESTLVRLWPGEAFGAFELLPLRRKDVKTAAAASGIEPESFLGELISRKAVPFAIKPLTLRFLLERFRRDGRLPDQIADIYLEGCRWLCAEENPSRKATGRKGKLSPDQRLAVAGRLAALTLFAGRTAISPEDPAEPIAGDLAIREALGGTEEENGQAVEITTEALLETLDTGLFTGRGSSQLGWAHQTYAEFLAARYVSQHGFDTTQKLDLVTHPTAGSRLVIPQLLQTTAWLVNLDPKLFAELVQDNPHVLLRSEAAGWDARQKAALTASLLKLFAELKLTDRDIELWRGFSKLDHPDLASQLEPFVRDHAANPVVRRVAIGIAEACRAAQLREALLEVALNKSDQQPARVQAIRGLRKIGDPDTRNRLATLLDTDLLEDDDDQIRGAVLSQVWPDVLAFNEITQHLTETKNPNLFGSYKAFLKYELAQRMRLTEIPQALAWTLAQEGSHCGRRSPIREATDNILKIACPHADNPAILLPLAEVIEARLKARHPLWNEDHDEPDDNPLQDAGKRHLIIQALVERAPDAQSLSTLKIIRPFREDDLFWLIQRAKAAPNAAEQERWNILVRELFLTDADRYWNPVLEASLQNRALAETFSSWFDPIPLDSARAADLRREWRGYQTFRAHRLSNPGTDGEAPALSSVLQQIDLVLQEIKDGAVAWRHLDSLLGDFQRHELDADIRKYRTWQNLKEEDRSRVVRAAQLHILEGEDPSAGAMSHGGSLQDITCFRALFLANAEDHDFCANLGTAIIAKWTPCILRKPGVLVDDGSLPYAKLLRLASQKVPGLVLQKISQAIDERNQEADDNGQPYLGMQLQECWNDEVERLLIEKLKGGELKPGVAADLTKTLLAKGSAPTQQWVRQTLDSPIPSGQEDRRQQLQVMLNRLANGSIESDEWTTTWNRITALAQLQDTFVDQTINHLYYEFQRSHFTGLSGSQLGEVCGWLRQHLPRSTRATSYGIDATKEIFRGKLYNYLEDAGTQEALYAIQHMARLEPDDINLKWILAGARQASLRQTWMPPTPADILSMARRPDSRIVNSGVQLLAVILESLERFQRKLHGHTPLVEFLWDKGAEPKDEGALSNFVKSHLEEDLRARAILLNREVEIRRSHGAEIRRGQETDILVDAVARNPRSGEPERISVIIEVKGCWNRMLKTEMKEQLVERYLAESAYRHGLYLIGWFPCAAWDTKDYRRGDTPKWTLAEATAYFQEQAAELSQGGLVIRSFTLDAALR